MTEKDLSNEEYISMIWNGYFYLIRKETIENCYQRNKTEQIYYPFEFNDIKKRQVEKILRYMEAIQD